VRGLTWCRTKNRLKDKHQWRQNKPGSLTRSYFMIMTVYFTNLCTKQVV